MEHVNQDAIEQEPATENDGTGAFSGSPNMEPDRGSYGNDDSIGNNDGTEPDPAWTDEDQA